MVTPETERTAAKAEAREFMTTFRSLQLATVGADGEPLASYAPFALLGDGQLGILLSELAAHTANLRARPSASVMLIEAEAQAPQIYARQRLVLQCSAVAHPNPSAQRTRIVAALQQRCGDVVEQLAQLPDFFAFTLTIERANFVKGFAQAYALGKKDLI